MKFLPSIFIIIAALAFNGCARSIEIYEIEALIRACEKHGGIHRIYTDLSFRAACRDGVFVAEKDGRKDSS